VIQFDEWFEINLLEAERDRFGPLCRAWLAKDYSVCGESTRVNFLGQVGVILATLIYYYRAGRFFHATQKGGKRSVDVHWDVDPNTIEWPDIPADAEEVKRAIVVLDDDGNEIARSETRSSLQFDEAGNLLADKVKAVKRGVVELDEAGNELSEKKARAVKRATPAFDEAGIPLPAKKVKAVKREAVELDEAGNELSRSKK